MSYPWTVYKTWVTGEVLTAGDLNSSFTTAVTNSDPSSINDYSVNVATMRTTSDPYPASAESLATTLSGELERLRYVVNQLNGTAQWYVDPSSSIETIVNGTQIFAGTKTFSTAITVNPVTNQLVLGATRTVTINAPTPAVSSRTWTIPDLATNPTFAALEAAQTFTGAKTFSATLTMSGATIAMGSQKITGLAAATTAGDALRYEQLLSGNVTLNGNLIFTTPATQGIVGQTSTTAVTAGNVGEVISSAVSGVAAATSNNYGNITSINLTAGHWIIHANAQSDAVGTVTRFLAAASAFSGNTTTDHAGGDNVFDGFLPTAGSNGSAWVTGWEVKINAGATYYLKARLTYTGSPTLSGRITATRIS